MPTAREPNDYYRTPPHCTRLLLTRECFDGPVWEPACGDGAISDVLVAAGIQVISTDLVDQGHGTPNVDFLAEAFPAASQIITNPPYKHAEAFVHHALTLGSTKVAMLLRLSWLKGERRRRTMFAISPPARVWVLSARPTLWNGSDPNARSTGGAISDAWYIWDASHTGPTTLGWLAKETAVNDALNV